MVMKARKKQLNPRPATHVKVSVSLSPDNLQKLQDLKIQNKSGFINWLLEQYYGLNSNTNEA